MARTTVVFVHGFISSPKCWDPLVQRLERDDDFRERDFRFVRFQYPTAFAEWNPAKRIPAISECGNSLDAFLEAECPGDKLFLVGHSMGGLVIQSYLADKLVHHRGKDLARIRSVILFATPNRGSTILGSLRGIFAKVWPKKNPQEEDLRVLNEEVARTNEIIVQSVLAAKAADEGNCPIPFRVFWGLQDDVVPEASARGSFIEASALPGGHSEILQPDPKDPNDLRYVCLKDALLNPVGHPSIYEIDLFEVNLVVSPASPEQTFVLSDLERPLTIHTDNVALRLVRIAFSAQNRCRQQYEQTYRSIDGHVESLGWTEPNEALPEALSEYYSEGKKLTYVFTPDHSDTYVMKVRIYNGFGEGQRNWHNHMRANAHYKLLRFQLNLKDYHDTGYALSPAPQLYFHTQNVMDHKLCANRVFEDPIAPLPGGEPWLCAWEIQDVKGGVVDLIWDVKKQAE